MKAAIIFTAIAVTVPGSVLAIPIVGPNGYKPRSHNLDRPTNYIEGHRIEAEPAKDHGVKIDITVSCEPPNKCKETGPKKTGTETSDTHSPFSWYALNRWARGVDEGTKNDEPHVPNPKSREWGLQSDKKLLPLQQVESKDGNKNEDGPRTREVPGVAGIIEVPLPFA